MATQADYATGTAAAQAAATAYVRQEVPGMFQTEADSFIAQMAAPLAKAVIDAVDAERAKQRGAS